MTAAPPAQPPSPGAIPDAPDDLGGAGLADADPASARPSALAAADASAPADPPAQVPAAGGAPPLGQARAARPDALHSPVLARMRAARAGPFLQKGAGRWVAAGILLLVAVILAPAAGARASGYAIQAATFAALTFLLATPGLMFGMGRRAFLVAALVAGALYAASRLGTSFLPVAGNDLFVAAVVLSFLIFALAGFNLVFIVEEMVYDAHRHIHLGRNAWMAAPTVLVLALAAALPVLHTRTAVQLPALWAASLAASGLLCAWWLVRAFGAWRGSRLLLRELHLFVFSVLLATALADAIEYLKQASALVPSLVAYVVLIGTWVYVTYTTLQRTHFLLKGRDALPWVSLILSASFAIVAHSQALYDIEGHVAVDNLVGQRVTYMVIGVWVGIAFYAGRAVWRTARLVVVDRTIGPRGRKVASTAANVAGSVLATERIVHDATVKVYEGLDRILPGEHQPPRKETGRPPQQPPA